MGAHSKLLSDGSNQSPKLRVFLNLDTLKDLPADSRGHGLEDSLLFAQLARDGFAGVQLTTDEPVHSSLSLPYCGLDRINTPKEAGKIVQKHAARGDLCITLHAGWGTEDDDDVFRLVEAILAAGEKHKLPVFLETHRATITQDIWRTVRLAQKFPDIRFNGDFSHYYCGQELVYGDWVAKLNFMEPIFERIGFLHGRIASSGCMQVPIDSNFLSPPMQAHGVANYLEHFKEMWIRAMAGFLRNAGKGDVLIFAPELLSGTYYYARKFPDASGRLEEECDRYDQAILLKDLARTCFEQAGKALYSLQTREP
jgi:hypothetical protein